jgi:hypothetical protein
MTIAVEAWRLREAARGAIVAGEPRRAFDLVSEAQETQATPAGGALLRLSAWLAASRDASGQ